MTNHQIAYLEDELHLPWLAAVHLCLFQHLIELRVRCLSNVENSPGQCYTRIKWLVAIIPLKFENMAETFNRREMNFQ